MSCIVVGVTGGIAAYKAVEIVRQLNLLGFQVKVIMTEHATRLVGPATFRAISGNPVALSLFEEEFGAMQHISLSHEADLIIVAPATANILAKMANGLADDLRQAGGVTGARLRARTARRVLIRSFLLSLSLLLSNTCTGSEFSAQNSSNASS